MKVSYYPGCTLKTKAKNMDLSAVASMKALGVELVELPRWNCCGAVFSLAEDDLLHLLAPVRDLIRVSEQGDNKLVVACSMCYNTLARANLLMREDSEKRYTINSFMEEEPDYHGEVEVVHLLNYLRDEIGWEKIEEHIKVPLTGLKVAPYYGCTLLRPQSVAIEPPGKHTLFKELLEALGTTVIDFPASADCCSSYQILSNPDIGIQTISRILESAQKWGADAIATSCPLCEYNVGRRQQDVLKKHGQLKELPTFYFTQLMAVALGLDAEICHFELNHGGALQLMESKKFLARMS
ncbi:MAG: CoB--CoM heterodisulfide reductase iron-sulfur subunit B family protein [Pseudomonadota bacterium]